MFQRVIVIKSARREKRVTIPQGNVHAKTV